MRILLRWQLMIQNKKRKQETKMKKFAAVYFTRHELTAEQISEAELIASPRRMAGVDSRPVMGVDFEVVHVHLKELASLDLSDDDNVDFVYGELFGLFADNDVRFFGGVFPPSLAAMLIRQGAPEEQEVLAYEAVNSQRSVEGDRPTFVFERWVNSRIFYI
jgi:hypothetical protein